MGNSTTKTSTEDKSVEMYSFEQGSIKVDKTDFISQFETEESSERILLAGKNGATDLEDDTSQTISNDWLSKKVEEERKKLSLGTDDSKLIEAKFKDLQMKGIFDNDGVFNENRALQAGQIVQLHRWSKKNPNLILEVADNAKYRVFERMDSYGVSESFVKKKKIEIADTSDERVLGIPYAQAMAGDRVYIINGKVFTGWALYFSLSSIKSPEDYARNVDLVYNVPYLWSSLKLKANLSLGVGFTLQYGSEAQDTPEEKIAREYIFNKLKINSNKLNKTAFHLYLYGNSYWALKRDPETGLVDKITILQPERLKIFLDPMTTKILFYIYLPPIIGGTTIASYPSDGRYNPNIITGVTLSYPTPVVIHPEDIIHYKINDFTEYPFGFSDIKSCQDSALARMDINILTPIIYKKYSKPIVFWQMKKEGLGPTQITTKKNEMIELLEALEPGSDIVGTDIWTPSVINAVNSGRDNMAALANDQDTQIFAATGVPETYFKPKGSTDRMISEQDKTFLTTLKIPQTMVSDAIEEFLVKPLIDYKLEKKKKMEEHYGEIDQVEKVLEESNSHMKNTPKYPKVKWNDLFKQSRTQLIADTLAMLKGEVISKERAAMILDELPEEKRDLNTKGVDSPMSAEAKVGERLEAGKDPELSNEPQAQGSITGENMEDMRGGLNVTGMKDESSRNINQVKDPTQLGGSRYSQHELKGEEPEGRPKSTHEKSNVIGEKNG